MLKCKTISHVAFQVKDMEESLRFYQEGLGFPVVCKKTYDFAVEQLRNSAEECPEEVRAGIEAQIRYFESKAGEPWFVYLRITDNQLLELFYADPDYSNDCRTQCSYRHLSLEVEDIEAAKRVLEERQIPMKTDIYMGPDHTKTLWIVDPDGNEIELMEYTAQSLQLM